MEPFSSKIEIALRDELDSYIGPRYSARQVTRSVMGFRPLVPQFCSIYDPHFWRHEHLWKLLGGLRRNPLQARDLEAVRRQNGKAGL